MMKVVGLPQISSQIVRNFSVNLVRDKTYVSTAHPKSHINLVKHAIPVDETDAEKRYRKMFEENQIWNHCYWAENNTRFQQEKALFMEKRRLKRGEDESAAFTQEDLMPFYREFLDKNYGKHISYNKEWYRRQFRLLMPAFRAYIDGLKRGLLKRLPSSKQDVN